MYVTLCIGVPNGNNQAFHRGVMLESLKSLLRFNYAGDRALIASEMVCGLRKRGLLLDEIAGKLANCNAGPESTLDGP